METNNGRLKKEIISLICVIVIICGFIALTYLEENHWLMLGLIYMLFIYIQSDLCMKFKNSFVKLLPMILLLIVGGLFTYKALVTIGYESVGYSLAAILAGIIFGTCLLVWGICLIANYRKKRREVVGAKL